MNLLLESLKALLFGIVEGVTEWLPIMHAEKNKVEA